MLRDKGERQKERLKRSYVQVEIEVPSQPPMHYALRTEVQSVSDRQPACRVTRGQGGSLGGRWEVTLQGGGAIFRR